ncbi:hypothetical protein KJI95_10095 [Shewanella sp. JM162201]|uniref:Uncharacterized protein n=1 Tax=Shewanella jiangmenensis TaxID=2837387 RepID=A0ABS5V355_9GAMM|nr:hypothetical protein [Shewanella jiangmenensis]MBT1444873.1 hypothetical protein [Shewanella jiangmenensis]
MNLEDIVLKTNNSAFKKNIFSSILLLPILLAMYLHTQNVHEKYWGDKSRYGKEQGTIYAVQTVELSTAAAGYPMNVARLLAQGDLEEIQNFVNTGYGLFGFAVTRCGAGSTKSTCVDETILAKTTPWDHWINDGNISQLIKNSDYSVLTNQHDAGIDWSYKAPKYDDIIDREFEPAGDIIGRLYYIRKPKPSYWEQLYKFVVKDMLNGTSSDTKYYLPILFSYLMVWIIACLLLTKSIAWYSDKIIKSRKEIELIDENSSLKDQEDKLKSDIDQLSNAIDSEKRQRKLQVEQLSKALNSEQLKHELKVKDLSKKLNDEETQHIYTLEEKSQLE